MPQLAAFLTSLVTATQARAASARRARGVSMLEYVLIAAVVIVVVTLFSEGFQSAVGRLVQRVNIFVG